MPLVSQQLQQQQQPLLTQFPSQIQVPIQNRLRTTTTNHRFPNSVNKNTILFDFFLIKYLFSLPTRIQQDTQLQQPIPQQQILPTGYG